MVYDLLSQALPESVGSVSFRYPAAWHSDDKLTGYGRSIVNALGPVVAALLAPSPSPAATPPR